MEEKVFHMRTKERSVNFTKEKMSRLQMLITKHQNILFCKKSDGVSAKQKESAWSVIRCEFNALGDTPRAVKQLKYKFENLKKTARKEATKERQEMVRTGGGPPPRPPNPDDASTADWLRTMMPISIDGNKSKYDDDSITIEVVDHHMAEESHLTKKPANSPEDVIELVADFITEETQPQNQIPDNKTMRADENEASATKEKWDFDPTTPYSSLKRPISSPLKCSAKKRRTAENINSNIVRHLLQEKKLSVMDSLHELELKKISKSIRHNQELHEQTLRHNAERHKLEMEKLQLDIKIFKKKLDF